MKHCTLSLFAISALFTCLSGSMARAEMRIGDICRVKGQEENTLHGLGLVVGLNGTGDGDTPTARALAKTMELMGSPLSTDQTGNPLLTELESAKNVAMVFVSVTVPGEGARQGDSLNCSISAIGAKSLDGGHLMLTPLLGPIPGDPRIYGFAQGPITLDRSGPPTVGRIHDGCRLETDFANSFLKDGKITLVLTKSHTSFHTAYDIEETLNNPQTFGIWSQQTGDDSAPSGRGSGEETREPTAKAIDQVNIEVNIPPHYRQNAVQFVHEVLDTRIVTPQTHARVVINERNGVIVIGESVEVAPVAVTHKSLSVQTGATAPPEGPLFILDQTADVSTTRLESLVAVLNALQVETQDIIDIING